jgi:cytochrome c oxidase cbb3-type subunit 3
MSKQVDTPIEGHEYDGIKEYDNPLPKWWLATFYGAIVFAVAYWGYFEVLGGPSHDERLASAMAGIESRQQEAAASFAADEGIDISVVLADETALAVGKEQYVKTCVPCHGELGQGSVGPNLTDDYWIHSRGDVQGVLASIRSGFPEKGMPPWGQIIPREEHVPLAAYVLTLRGTDPPNPKAPEGVLVEE